MPGERARPGVRRNMNYPGGDRPFPRRRFPGADLGPRRLGETLDEALARLVPPNLPSPASAGVLSAIFARWEEIAGPAMARHVRPIRMSGVTLLVMADRPAWATQVRLIGPGLLARLEQVTGEAPERLEVIVRPPSDSPGTHQEPGRIG